MKPVVSSLVALALAIVPVYAMAAPEKPAPAQTAKSHKKPAAAASHASHKKPAKNLDTVAHKGEPKGGNVTIVPASMTSAKPKPEAAASKLPKLPAPAAASSHKAQKAGAEKAAPRKPSKKSESADKSNDGQPERDEETAELVARIKRGTHDGIDKVSHTDAEDARCRKAPVEIIRGPETDTFTLMKCDGKPAPLAIDHLSILVRPGNADRPTTPLDELAKKKGNELAKGIKRVDAGLPMRLQAIADHFTKKGSPAKFSIVSGYRPASIGSMHQNGRAVDFRLEGVKNEEVVAFCKTLVDTGCGFYPNSSFVHMDVRDAGTGHTSWIDMSGPGEQPKYVHAWPPPSDEKSEKSEKKSDESEPLEKTSLEKTAEPAKPEDASQETN